MSFCLIEATNLFRFVSLPGLFVNVRKDEEAGKKEGYRGALGGGMTAVQ